MKDSVTEESPPTLTRERARALRAAQTEVERRLWQRLRHRQLNGAKFRRQHPIGGFIVDFFCMDSRLVIELDGSHHGEESERHADERRTEYLASQGYRVLRFWNEEVLDNIDGVLETIAKLL
jgi:very-short-patch-repair endonuclease